jgi:hypothetical protein
MANNPIVYNLANTTANAADRAKVTCYENSSINSSADYFIIGNERASSTANCYVTRIAFTTPTDVSSYSTFEFKISNALWYPTISGGTALRPKADNPDSYYHVSNDSQGDADTMFRFGIGLSASDTTFIKANSATVGDGFISCITNEANGTQSAGYYTLVGQLDLSDKQLEPDTTYYVWLFPGGYSFSKYYRYWFLGSEKDYPTQATLTFSGEGVPEVKSTILWAYDGIAWRQGLQRIYDGTAWL